MATNQNKMIEDLLESLQNTDEEAVFSGLQTLWINLENNTLSAKEIIDSSLINFVINFLQDPDYVVVLHSLKIYILCFNSSTEEQRSVYDDLGANTNVVKLVSDEDFEIRKNATEFLLNVCIDMPTECQRLVESGILLEMESVSFGADVSIHEFYTAASLITHLLISSIENTPQGEQVLLSQYVSLGTELLSLLDHYCTLTDCGRHSFEHDVDDDELLTEEQKIVEMSELQQTIAIALSFFGLMTTIDIDGDEDTVNIVDTYMDPLAKLACGSLQPHSPSFFPALRVIGNMTLSDDSASLAFMDCDLMNNLNATIEHLLGDGGSVLNDESESVGVMARWMLCWIGSSFCAGGEALIQSFIDSSVIHSLHKLLNHSALSIGVKNEYVFCISNCVFSGNVEQVRYFYENGCGSYLVSLNETTTDSNVKNVINLTLVKMEELGYVSKPSQTKFDFSREIDIVPDRIFRDFVANLLL